MPKIRSKKQKNLWFVLSVVLVAAAAVAVNLLLPYWQRAAAVYPDLTPEGLYSVSDRMRKQMEVITKDVDVTFCADEDVLLGTHDTRYVYVLAKKLEKEFPNVHVSTVDVRKDPSSVDRFRTTQLSKIAWNDVIVSRTGESGTQYRILSAASFWSAEDGEYTNFNGEFKLASAMLSLTAFDDGPMACFTVGHGEKYYDTEDPGHGDNAELAAFADLLTALGLRIGKVNLDEEEIPDDCVLLIMDGPTEDYDDNETHYGDYRYRGALEKIDRYLAGYEAFLVLRDPEAGALPSLNGYLGEWGISFRNDVVLDSSSTGALTAEGDAETDPRRYLVAAYATENEGTVGYSMYRDIADVVTSPRTILENCSSIDMTWGDLGEQIRAFNVSRMVSGLFFSSSNTVTDTAGNPFPTAISYQGGKPVVLPVPYTLAAVSTETRMGADVDYYNAYVVAVGTTRLIAGDYLDNNAFCNYDTVYSVLRTVSRTDRYADRDLGGLTLNSLHYGGKELWEDRLYAEKTEQVYLDAREQKYTFVYNPVTDSTRAWVTVLLAVPCAILIPLVGIMIHNRRKYR